MLVITGASLVLATVIRNTSKAEAFDVSVAVMLNAPPLFYMSTALLMTIGISRLQAFLAIGGLISCPNDSSTAARDV